MALYHFHVDQISRGKAQTVVAAAAYRAGEKLHNDYYDETHNYSFRKDVTFHEILLPEHVPEKYRDRSLLWNELEQVEKNPSAQLAYSFNIALQNELTMEENIQLAKEFCEQKFVAKGMIVDLAVHSGDSDNLEEETNPHFHVLSPIRPMTQEGIWGEKQHRVYKLDEHGERMRNEKGSYIFNAEWTTDWGRPETLEHWREAWANSVNRKFAEKGIHRKIDHRSYEAQGLPLIPTIHKGPVICALEEKGIETEIGTLNRMIKAANQAYLKAVDLISWFRSVCEELRGLMEKEKNPTLVDLLQEHYDRRNEVANTYQYGRQKAHLKNLKSEVETINYLQENNILTVEQLKEKIEEVDSAVGKKMDEMRPVRGKIHQLQDLLEKLDRWRELKPVNKEYNSFFFAGKKKKFYQEHGKEIREFQMCKRVLDEHKDATGKYPTAQWNYDLEQLVTKMNQKESDLAPLKQELKKLKSVQKIIDQILAERNVNEANSESTRADRTQRQEVIKPGIARALEQKDSGNRQSVRERLQRNQERIKEQENKKQQQKKKPHRGMEL